MHSNTITTQRHSARRAAVVVLATTVVVAAPAAAASARGTGSGWQPVTGLPDGVTVYCGTAPVTLEFPLNREYTRTLDGDSPAVDHVDEFTGSLTVRYTTASGRSVTLSAGGPGRTIYWTNGDVETHSEGWYNYAFPDPAQASALGLPQIVSTTGLIDYVTHPDQTVTPVHIPQHVVDVCGELGLG